MTRGNGERGLDAVSRERRPLASLPLAAPGNGEQGVERVGGLSEGRGRHRCAAATFVALWPAGRKVRAKRSAVRRREKTWRSRRGKHGAWTVGVPRRWASSPPPPPPSMLSLARSLAHAPSLFFSMSVSDARRAVAWPPVTVPIVASPQTAGAERSPYVACSPISLSGATPLKPVIASIEARRALANSCDGCSAGSIDGTERSSDSVPAAARARRRRRQHTHAPHTHDDTKRC